MTSNREDVSWSSSEGSTYYSDDGTSLQLQDSEASTDYSEDEVSLQQRKQSPRISKERHDDDSVSYSTKSYGEGAYYQRSKDRKETTPSTNDFRPRTAKERPQKVDRKKKDKLVLENVDNFSSIEIASGSEGVSAVAFLSTEDTAQVFCKAGIPNVITANKNLYENISAVSSSSTSNSSAESSDSSDSESDEESRRHQDKHAKYEATDTERAERATVRSRRSEVSTAETSVPSNDRHAVDLVSVSYQDPVSSLECTSTWDALSLGSDTSGSSSVEKPIVQKTTKSPVQRRETVISHQSRMKAIKRKKSDLKTDERIRQLKAKIKSIQDMSATHVTVSSTEVESHLSSIFQSKKTIESQKSEKKMDTTKVETGETLTNRFESQQRKSASARKDYRQSFETVKSMVGTVIHEVEREEISVLRLDASARAVGKGDIEEGQTRFSKSEKRRTSITEHTAALRTSITEHTKAFVVGVQYRTIAAYDEVVPIVARKRSEFLRKPRYEQILIIAIGSLFSIFLVLLFVMIAQ